MKTIKCIVAVTDANGSPDFFPVIVRCTQEEYNTGEHLVVAAQKAIRKNYQSYLVYDENDPGFKKINIHWEFLGVIPIVSV
jgi:hypothetical protein